MMPSKTEYNEPIAIIGSACHFAGNANSPSELWKLLRDPKDVQSEIPTSRFSAKGFYHPNPAHHGHSNVKNSYLINDDPAVFDAEFFGINSMEGNAMDPQQRWLMETVYESIEAAGMTIEGLQGSDTGVFTGVMCGDYEAMLLRDLDMAPTYFALGTSRSILSNRISYFFNWHGPSITIDTACSSSLVAVHLAVQALRAGDSRIAIACGSNVILGPENYIIESKLKMLSPDGRSRMWDRDANGYARGDGVAAVVLKTLRAALVDGDHIERIIRETGVNQDGATAGITMPSASAQQALIQSIYVKAGLDITKDRPQYFEAHGTGTPAGDPVEAEAINRAFFGQEQDGGRSKCPLYVGSIKTVLGHTEGTAGVAAILKASLAVQHSCIPPNLLFENLSAAVMPFYKFLEVPCATLPWPELPPLQPRRASVNSFGFGGTNAHAILESYKDDAVYRNNQSLFTPFVFSAMSDRSLRANLSAYATYLEEYPKTTVSDLAYTLRERRSIFPYRISFTASSLEDLRAQILTRLEDTKIDVGIRTQVRRGGQSRILAVFTGQGAQYARMGADLIRMSAHARRIIQDLESHLAQLPGHDRPTWSLQAELLADSSSSRVNEAVISQPLCTAVQIMLVDILQLADITNAVVGHSLGEIAAAYAAGALTARDAMYISYYRGLHSQHAASPNGDIKGAMLAVGTSMEDATELCNADEFAGRITLAASNSSSNVTISGDEDAIKELQVILEDEKKFYRRLRVDKAYHSPHMQPCFKPYAKSLEQAKVTAPSVSVSPRCDWFSSVYGRLLDSDCTLSNEYWAENMTNPVLFSQALTAALLSDNTQFDMVLEVGPHPALHGPASQTIQDVLQKKIPYQGTLSRGQGAATALSKCLGSLWSHLSIDLHRYEVAMLGVDSSPQFSVVKGLPPYQWNHEVRYWYESRRSRRMRLREQPFHSLLGDICPDSAPHHLRWKNVLRSKENEWLEGHKVQNQIVFPAAGYVSTAFEAGRFLADGRGIRIIELYDLAIHQAILFDGEEAGVEIMIEISDISRDQQSIRAKFTYSAVLGSQEAQFSLAASALLQVYLGDASPDLLPARGPTPPHLIDVDQAHLYNFLDSLGYNFTGRFRSLSNIRRKLGHATCQVENGLTEEGEPLLVHPATLDAAFQSIMLAYSYPGDGQLRIIHLPTAISRIRINPALCDSYRVDSGSVDSGCLQSDRATPGSGFSGYANIYLNGYTHPVIQVDKAKFVPLNGVINNDRNVFYKMRWIPSSPEGEAAAEGIPVTQSHKDLMWILSRISSFYLRKFDQEVPPDAPARTESPLSHYLNYAHHMTQLLINGQHQYARQEWLNDTWEDLMNAVAEYADIPDVQIMLLVGETMPRVFRGETAMLEQFRVSGLLDKYYADGFGTAQSSQWLGQVMKQITDCHPHLHILEIGAGTGGATKNVLRAIDQSFDLYTFTDVSSSFFENANELFASWRDRMVFKVCDMERDPKEQGFVEGEYDVIIASLVIHATARLDHTMRNLHRMLKPGGYLVVAEGASDGPLQSGDGFIFGSLPGWWLGVEEGRTLSPFLTRSEWDTVLRRTGFSGLDTLAPPLIEETFGIVLFVSQAMDEHIALLRQPLLYPTTVPDGSVVIVGGLSQLVAGLVNDLRSILHQHYGRRVITYQTLQEIDYDALKTESTVLCLTELDQPVFKNLVPERWYSFRQMFETGKKLLWVTSGRLGDDPFSNMTVGFGRSAVHETDDLRLQFLDFPDPSQITAVTLAECMIRFQTATDLKADGRIFRTVEPEIVFDAAGRQLVPRFQFIAEANDRYNSAHRAITQQVNQKQTAFELCQCRTSCYLRRLSRYDATDESIQASTIELHTTHSILSALKTPLGPKFLAIGVDSAGTRYLVLVPSLASILTVPRESAVSYNLPGLFENNGLALVAAHIVSSVIVDPLVAGQKLVVHNALDIIAHTIVAQASAKDVQTIFTLDAMDKGSPQYSRIRLSPFISRSELGRILPEGIASFAGFSTTDQPSETELMIISSLSPHCRTETTSTLHSAEGMHTGPSGAAILAQLIETAISWARESIRLEPHIAVEVASLEHLTTRKRPDDPLTIVDWVASPSLPVHVTRVDAKPLFKGDKTYWVCGMSGALGISLCDWMIGRGVKHLVLTSRNPKIEPAWIENHKRQGIAIKILLCDVTDEKALRAVHQTVVETFPPIVGVLNGAMVLRDISIRNMMFDQMIDVMNPKALGSLHLDRIFYDVQLDFFVLLSSVNCVFGSPGQANYAAANMYMCGLAANRRKRGLRATAVNVGAIIGAGYIIRETNRALDLTVQKMALMHLSEDDFHQIFAEAIEAGHLDSPNGPELSTGILNISSDSPNIPPWSSNPQFAHFIINQNVSRNDKEQTVVESIQDHLQTCYTPDDIRNVIRRSFATQLRKILQTSTADDDLLLMGSKDLGLDSLISVDIRTWFLKNFQVSIPVLKIMGNNIMGELVEYTVQNISTELVPHVRMDLGK